MYFSEINFFLLNRNSLNCTSGVIQITPNVFGNRIKSEFFGFIITLNAIPTFNRKKYLCFDFNFNNLGFFVDPICGFEFFVKLLCPFIDELPYNFVIVTGYRPFGKVRLTLNAEEKTQCKEIKQNWIDGNIDKLCAEYLVKEVLLTACQRCWYGGN